MGGWFISSGVGLADRVKAAYLGETGECAARDPTTRRTS
jgi:hypothetical protein